MNFDTATEISTWTHDEAVELCRKIEVIAPEHGAHVALTGGTLYKYGPRKDLDILFYRIRQVDHIDVDGLMAHLTDIGITPREDYGWVHKAQLGDKQIDFFFPERKETQAMRAIAASRGY